ncbi:hypothetical protein [Clostridium felsineum]|uniref:hypothetical protein n=1 Tax=Clostridium felsineum TaxID=36839 RepID=UPI00098CE217|nr:hypothetical protein [Clostridium felsineum]URZ02732.1 hypothetical protein CLAUR_027560 [Clostridium felsineum]
MNKKIIIEAYKSTEEEWKQYSLKEKSKKISEYLNTLEVKTHKDQLYINNLLIMIEELEEKELSELLEKIHYSLMECNMRIIESMED